MPATPGGGLMMGSLSNEERQELEEERERLYQQLDDKDKEINQQSQYVEKLKKKMLDQEELIASARRDYEQLQQKMNRIQQKNESAKEKIKEVLQALEKLAVNYDQKLQEIELMNKEQESMIEELLAKQIALNNTLSELQQLCDMSAHQRKRIAEILANFLKDLDEIGVVIGGESNENLKVAPPESNNKLEEECTVARLSTGEKSEVKNLIQSCLGLEIFQTDCNKEDSEYEKDLAELQLFISQHEARIQTSTESMKEAETGKRALEEDVDTLREEDAKLKVAEHVQAVTKLDDSLPIPATPGGGLMMDSLSNEERQKLEEECEDLYELLDDKDDEIIQQSQDVDKLIKMLDQEELMASARRDYEQLQQKMNRIQKKTKSAKEEIEEVLPSFLEKLADDYDQRSQKIELMNKEHETMIEKLSAKQIALNNALSEMQQLCDMSELLFPQKRIEELLINCLKDVRELTVAINRQAKMKSEVMNLVINFPELDSFNTNCSKKVSEYEKELVECQLLISQHEARIQTLTESMKKAETDKRALEEDVDALREECAKLKVAEQVQAVTNKEKAEEKEAATKMRAALEEQRDAHQKQVAALRDKLSVKQELISALENSNYEFTLVYWQKHHEVYYRQTLKEAHNLVKLSKISLEDAIAKSQETIRYLLSKLDFIFNDSK